MLVKGGPEHNAQIAKTLRSTLFDIDPMSNHCWLYAVSMKFGRNSGFYLGEIGRYMLWSISYFSVFISHCTFLYLMVDILLPTSELIRCWLPPLIVTQFWLNWMRQVFCLQQLSWQSLEEIATVMAWCPMPEIKNIFLNQKGENRCQMGSRCMFPTHSESWKLWTGDNMH